MSYDNFDHVYLGIKLFHEGRFHEAHEEIEKFWQNYYEADRCLYQAFIQICACLHLINEKRYTGAQKVLERARKNIFQNEATDKSQTQNLNQLSELKKFIDLEKIFLDTEALLNEHLRATDFII
jgi:predicted metal-dependent hydrolase